MNDANHTNFTEETRNPSDTPAALPDPVSADSSKSHPAFSMSLIETAALKWVNVSSLAILPLLRRVTDRQYAAIDSSVNGELCRYTPPKGSPLLCSAITVNATDVYLFAVARTADEETLSAISQACMAYAVGSLSPLSSGQNSKGVPMVRIMPEPILVCLDPLPAGSPLNPLITDYAKDWPGLGIKVIHYFSLPPGERESPAFAVLGLLRLLEPYKALKANRSPKQVRDFRTLIRRVLLAVNRAAWGGLLTQAGLKVFREEAGLLLQAAYEQVPELRDEDPKKDILQILLNGFERIHARHPLLLKLEDARNMKDGSTRLFFEIPENAADVINALIFNGKKGIDPKFLRKASQRSQLKIGGGLRVLERDNAFYLVDDLGIVAKIGLEHEVDGDPEISKRAGGYDFSDYIAQVFINRSGKAARQEFPVITFVLYYGRDPWKGENLTAHLEKYGSYSRLPGPLQKYVIDRNVFTFDISHLDDATTEKFHGDFWFVAKAVQGKLNYELIRKSGRTIQHPKETFDLLHSITGKDDYEEWFKRMNVKPPKEGDKNMAAQSLIDVIYQGGVDYGVNQGVDLGVDLGRMLQLLELFQEGFLSLEDATMSAKMGTDTDRFLRTAAQCQKEYAQRKASRMNAQSV